MLSILLKIVFLCSYGYSEDIKDLNPIQLIKLGEDISQISPYDVKSSDVTFYLVTQSQPEPVFITPQNKDVINVKKKTKFVIHGWLENRKRSWLKNIGEEFLKNYDINFIEVDWERPARMPYIYSAKSTGLIGNQVAKFIQDTALSPRDIHIIGHSLGAHIAGIAGKNINEYTGQKLARISGLDPAGPYFWQPAITLNDRLDKDDADIVDAIHTDAAFCSHSRSTKYFTEWINIGKFQCKFCKPVLGVNFFGDRCVFHQQELILGSEDVTKNVTGVCFARTNNEEPYLS